MEGYDILDIIHRLKQVVSPVKPGISNTDQALFWYILTADNELDYDSSITGSVPTTVTVSELPSTTICLIVYIFLQHTADDNATLILKRSSGDTQAYSIKSKAAGATSAEHGGIFLIPTNGNQFYISATNLSGGSNEFKIIGYCEKQ